jgi:hypothetical protein
MEDVVPESKFESMVTPKKRKFCYVSLGDDLATDDPLLSSSLTSWDLDAPKTVKALANSIQQLDSKLRDFQLAVGEDVDSLLTRVHEVKVLVGVQPTDGSLLSITEECSTIWEMFTMMRSLILDPAKVLDLETKVHGIVASDKNTTHKVRDLERSQAEIVELVSLLITEQENQAKGLNWATGSPAFSHPDHPELSNLVQRLQVLENYGAGGGDVSTLKAHVKLLEARLPSDPFTIGGRTFNSKADVALFVETDMPGLSFSLFHDVVTLMESITDGHTRKSEVMAEMYQASRVGLDEDEASHVHSFKLIIPSLLGATKEGDKNDPRYPLPAVKDFGAWNPQDNEGGIKKRIQDGMDDVSLAVTESILVACTALPAAQKLATEMMYQTQVFINELCSWVDSFYMELIKTSQVPPGEAWLLVAACIRKFFEVLRKLRAPADRASSKMDNPTRTTAYLWAMIQVHRELKNIRAHNFRGHPAVAPVITLHVFKTRVTNTAFDKLAESLKSIEKKLTDTQKNFDKLHDRVSKLEKKN